MKVKRGLFSCPVEEHLPSQNYRTNPILVYFSQVIANIATCQKPSFPTNATAEEGLGQKTEHSCTLAAGHYPAPGNAKLKSRLGRVYELPATVRSLPGRKWYGGQGPLRTSSQFFNCLAAVL